LLVATAILLAIGLVALANLRRNDVVGLEAALADGAATPSLGALRDTLTGAAGRPAAPTDAGPKEER
jgi:hypothetical protein